MVILVSLPHPENAELPIDVTELGMVTLVIFEPETKLLGKI